MSARARYRPWFAGRRLAAVQLYLRACHEWLMATGNTKAMWAGTRDATTEDIPEAEVQRVLAGRAP